MIKHILKSSSSTSAIVRDDGVSEVSKLFSFKYINECILLWFIMIKFIFKEF